MSGRLPNWKSGPACAHRGTSYRTDTRSIAGCCASWLSGALKSAFTVTITTERCFPVGPSLIAAPAINRALAEFGAVGFRAPMVHRNLAWLQSLDIDYDASCFDVDPFQAMPGGVGGVWPFVAGRFVELPYTLPQDHILFIALGESNGRRWTEKLAYLERLCGMALVITHPDYLDSPERIDVYRRFLVQLREIDLAWNALPREVAAWWRLRDELMLRQEASGKWSIYGTAAHRARPVRISVARGTSEFEWSFTPLTSSIAASGGSAVSWSTSPPVAQLAAASEP